MNRNITNLIDATEKYADLTRIIEGVYPKTRSLREVLYGDQQVDTIIGKLDLPRLMAQGVMHTEYSALVTNVLANNQIGKQLVGEWCEDVSDEEADVDQYTYYVTTFQVKHWETEEVFTIYSLTIPRLRVTMMAMDGVFIAFVDGDDAMSDFNVYYASSAPYIVMTDTE